ncbi:hypothetical protein BH23GEM8_BH23GEM8_23850 [soil metagenome]
MVSYSDDVEKVRGRVILETQSIAVAKNEFLKSISVVFPAPSISLDLSYRAVQRVQELPPAALSPAFVPGRLV